MFFHYICFLALQLPIAKNSCACIQLVNKKQKGHVGKLKTVCFVLNSFSTHFGLVAKPK